MDTKEQILNAIKLNPRNKLSNERIFTSHYPFHYQDILTWTFPGDFTFAQKLYHYLNNDPELKLGVCPICGKRCRFKNFIIGYLQYCSGKCSNSSQDKIQKSKLTCIRKYGVDNYNKTDEGKQKIIDSFQEKYGVSHYAKTKEYITKKEKTCQERYGVSYYSQSKEYMDKRKKCSLEKYGVDDYTQTAQFRERKKKTCQERYGGQGFESNKIYSKIKQTIFDKYNTKFFSQTSDFHTQRSKKWFLYKDTNGEFIVTRKKDPNINECIETFDSSWELDVYLFCIQNNLNFNYQPNITFTYTYNNETHYYHPDFLIEGKLYEVKGDQFFNNKGEMINPYNEENSTKEHKKYQCMIENNVIILRGEEIKNLNISTFK